MSKTRFKKPIAMLVSLLMILSLIPMTVFAAEAPTYGAFELASVAKSAGAGTAWAELYSANTPTLNVVNQYEVYYVDDDGDGKIDLTFKGTATGPVRYKVGNGDFQPLTVSEDKATLSVQHKPPETFAKVYTFERAVNATEGAATHTFEVLIIWDLGVVVNVQESGGSAEFVVAGDPENEVNELGTTAHPGRRASWMIDFTDTAWVTVAPDTGMKAVVTLRTNSGEDHTADPNTPPTTLTPDAHGRYNLSDLASKVYWIDVKFVATDATVSGVKVKGVAAVADTTGKIYNAELPYGTVLADLAAGDIAVTKTDENATVGTPATEDNGETWTVLVTAEDNTTTATYTINVTVAADPVLEDIVSGESELEVNGTLVTGIVAAKNTTDATKVSELVAAFTVPDPEDYHVAVYASDAEDADVVADTAPVGTGMVVKLLDDEDNAVDSVTVVINGDIQGDGVADISDYVTLARSVASVVVIDPSSAFFTAADLNVDNQLDISDYAMLAAQVNAL